MFGPNQQGVKHFACPAFRSPLLFVPWIHTLVPLMGPTPKQKAAAREVDRMMNYEEINESPEDRLGETTLVQIFHPVIGIGPARHNYVYRLHFASSGVYRCDRCSEWGLAGDRLFLFRNAAGPGP